MKILSFLLLPLALVLSLLWLLWIHYFKFTLFFLFCSLIVFKFHLLLGVGVSLAIEWLVFLDLWNVCCLMKIPHFAICWEVLEKIFVYSIYIYPCVKVIQIRIFSWYVFFCIQALYRNLPYKSPYSVQTQEKMQTRKSFFFIWTFFKQYILNIHSRKLAIAIESLNSINSIQIQSNLQI